MKTDKLIDLLSNLEEMTYAGSDPYVELESNVLGHIIKKLKKLNGLEKKERNKQRNEIKERIATLKKLIKEIESGKTSKEKYSAAIYELQRCRHTQTLLGKRDAYDAGKRRF